MTLVTMRMETISHLPWVSEVVASCENCGERSAVLAGVEAMTAVVVVVAGAALGGCCFA